MSKEIGKRLENKTMLFEQVLTGQLDQVTWLQLNWPPGQVTLSELENAVQADANWKDLVQLEFLVWTNVRKHVSSYI